MPCASSPLRAELAFNLAEVHTLGAIEMSSRRTKRPRVHLVHVMVLITLIAIGLRVPAWWGEWWATKSCEHRIGGNPYWREKPTRDAWANPITIRVGSQDDLGSVLSRFKATTAQPRLRRGLPVLVDPGGLHEAGLTL